jgi:hypothetical protein
MSDFYCTRFIEENNEFSVKEKLSFLKYERLREYLLCNLCLRIRMNQRKVRSLGVFNKNIIFLHRRARILALSHIFYSIILFFYLDKK